MIDVLQLRSDPVVRQILDERAQALMAQHAAATIERDEKFLAFRLGEGGYSVPARLFREVTQLGEYRSLHDTTSPIVGLVHMYGRLVAILDVRPLLGMQQTPLQSPASVLMLAVNGSEVGLLADSVAEVCKSTGALTPAASTLAGCNVPWVRGIDHSQNLVLDPSTLLADPRLIVNGLPC